MGVPCTIQILCPDGNPDNMRVVGKGSRWTGKIYYITRDYWNRLTYDYRKNLKVPGIYVLVGREDSNDGDDNLQTIYIGQSENLCARLDQHIQDPEKSFFSNIVCVTESTDFNNINFEWVEAFLIEKANESDACNIENKTVPKKPRITEVDEGEVNYFIKEALQIFPFVDINIFAAKKGDTSQKLLVPMPKSKLRKSRLKTTNEEYLGDDASTNSAVEILEIIFSTEVWSPEHQRNISVYKALQSRKHFIWHYGIRVCDTEDKGIILASQRQPIKSMLKKTPWEGCDIREVLKSCPYISEYKKIVRFGSFTCRPVFVPEYLLRKIGVLI